MMWLAMPAGPPIAVAAAAAKATSIIAISRSRSSFVRYRVCQRAIPSSTSPIGTPATETCGRVVAEYPLFTMSAARGPITQSFDSAIRDPSTAGFRLIASIVASGNAAVYPSSWSSHRSTFGPLRCPCCAYVSASSSELSLEP